MNDFSIGSPTRSQRASRDGTFDQVYDDELSSPPMCGQAVITKILGKSPGRPHQIAPLLDTDSNRGTKSCISISASKKMATYRNQRYQEVGSPRSPDTESSSSSEREEPEQTTFMQPVESLPSFIVQFDPQELRALQEEKLKDSPINKGQNQQTPGQNQQPPMAPFSRTSLWPSTLSPVTEEQSFELEDKSHASQSQASRDVVEKPPSDAALPSSEKSEKVAAMRKLVLKQQNALQELSKQNSQYRRELGESKNKLLKMQKERSQQQERIVQLIIEKEAIESECVWLREEMKIVRSAVLPKKDDERLRRKFERLMELEVASEASSSYAGDSDIDVQGIFKKALMASKESDSKPVSSKKSPLKQGKTQSKRGNNESQQKFQTLMSIASSSSDDAPFDEEDKAEIEAFRNLKKSIEADGSFSAIMKDAETGKGGSRASKSRARTRETREDTVSRTSSLFETRDASEEHISTPSKAANTKEEVALFKQRLESIQKKRVKRHLDRNRSPTKVRFM